MFCGDRVGKAVGVDDGASVGWDGATVGTLVGAGTKTVNPGVGADVGGVNSVGFAVGLRDLRVGRNVGDLVGREVRNVGEFVGRTVGEKVGILVGLFVSGRKVGT